MKTIKTCNIIGMGALGLMYADMIQTNLGSEAVQFLLNENRFEKYRNSVFNINGKEKQFSMISEKDAVPVDLVIVAVKYPGFEDALKTMEKVVGPNTIIISVMNGILSEERLAEKFGAEKVLYSVAQAMDTMKFGNELIFSKTGELRIGAANGSTQENLKALEEYFERAGIAYTEESDILHRLWNKLMCNVGINQTCMVYGKNYGQVFADEKAYGTFRSAMKEVMQLSVAAGINLSENDMDFWDNLIRTFNQSATPSMGQDRICKRKSEVELFAGTVIKLGKKYGIPVPVNEWLYQQVQEIESKY